MIERCIAAKFDVLALTVDTMMGGNRERDLQTGFTSPPRFTIDSLLSFVTHPGWAANYFTHKKIRTAPTEGLRERGFKYFGFCRGLYDAGPIDELARRRGCPQEMGQAVLSQGNHERCGRKRAVDIGATGIMVSNHGGRQLDGSRSSFDQLAEIIDAVGDRIDVIRDGGLARGTHVLKALSLGAKACSGGRLYLYALAAAGQAGVERALGNFRAEIERDMKLMGCRTVDQLSRDNLRFR
jgi:L-lactate dehydrogenase (cytochrome)